MASQFNLEPNSSRSRLREDFVSGLASFRGDEYEIALELFRSADESAEVDDIYQNRYTSFHGLTRVLTGDARGVKLCRKAAVGETNDAEVYYNLALAEHRLGERESSYQALRRGLAIAPEHSGLLQLKKDIVLREQRSFIAGLRRHHWLNRMIGKLFRGTRKPYSDR